MEKKYTPSPWYVVNYSGYISLQDKDEYGISNLFDEDYTDKALVNATLAAAAPNLLENLIRLVDRLEESGYSIISFPALRSAKEAIAKAQGDVQH